IVTDSKPVPQYEVLRWVASQLQVGVPAQLPASGGKRLSNKVMLETGFKLQYPDYMVGYHTLLPV
ncbi:MAG TPA: SDR family NAD(P)-dependent oxidoreductase, partial [Methylotenera sp.]|nr:SDR family NAD(P)-dependent oxidoreductase [Methylotenera sp.]